MLFTIASLSCDLLVAEGHVTCIPLFILDCHTIARSPCKLINSLIFTIHILQKWKHFTINPKVHWRHTPHVVVPRNISNTRTINVILYMPSLENKLESIALKLAIALKTEGHWNLRKNSTKNIKPHKKIDWLLKDIIKINPYSDTDKMRPILDKN